MKKLNVNIDHVATLRQARLGTYPDPIEIAQLVEKTKERGRVARFSLACSLLNRTFKFPSAVSLKRLHPPQK